MYLNYIKIYKSIRPEYLAFGSCHPHELLMLSCNLKYTGLSMYFTRIVNLLI